MLHRHLWASALPALILAGCAGPLSPDVPDPAAVPAYVAVANAKTEADTADMTMVAWLPATVGPMHHGWCVRLEGVRRDGRVVAYPVFVEQDGRAWRTDSGAKRKYDGGADGMYMPPGFAADCTASAPTTSDKLNRFRREHPIQALFAGLASILMVAVLFGFVRGLAGALMR